MRSHIPIILVIAMAGCTSSPKVLDRTEAREVCSLHDAAFQTEEVPVWHGRVSRYEPFDLEDYVRFPHANDNGLFAVGHSEDKRIKHARISFCPECRRVKSAELKLIEQRGDDSVR